MFLVDKMKQIKNKITKNNINDYSSFSNAKASISNKKTELMEAITIATTRLELKAEDYQAEKAWDLYNKHKIQLNNQWISPANSINSGFGNAQNTYYAYQTVNYLECYMLAQDPLFNKLFNILSETPFSKGGKLIGENLTPEQQKAIEKTAEKFELLETTKKGVRSSFVAGGCFDYMDFGLDNLEEPLNFEKVNYKQFKGFRHIDPINVAVVEVNTINPASADYMKPNKWYIIGLGIVHKSHLLQYQENEPELIYKPICMYFGMPLTLLIKQDVANTTLASQGLANLLNRFRNIYLKTDMRKFVIQPEEFRQRLELMSDLQDNFSTYCIGLEEDIQQLVTPLNGMAENIEIFYQLVSAKTDIPLTELMKRSARGENATGEGDRKSWYDKVKSIQEKNKKYLLIKYKIIAGYLYNNADLIEDYEFNNLEVANQKEEIEMDNQRIDIAIKLQQLGFSTDSIAENYLKNNSNFSNLQLSGEVDKDLLTYEPEIIDKELI